MLRQNSSEVPSSFTPQWLQNRATPAAQAQPSSPSAAARRDEKPWVAERWANDKETDSKWGHDSPFDRSRAWAEDERDRERLVGGPRRDPARRKPNEWGVTGSTQPREPFAQDRWGDSSLRDPLREPTRSDRWRADEKTDKWGPRGDRLDLQEGQTRERWRAPGARLDDRGFGDRPGDRLSREEYRSPGEERLGPHKGRGFGFGRGRGAGTPLAPGSSSFDSWGSKDLNGLGGGMSLGRAGSVKRRPVQVYTMQHLEDLKDMMIYKLKVDDLPLPKGLTVDTLAELYKHHVDEHHDDEHEPQPEWVTEPVHPPGEGPTAATAADAAAAKQPAATAAPDAALAPPPSAAAATGPAPAAAPVAPSMPALPPGMPLEALDADVWIYRDPSGNEQGPFNKADILDWLEAGYFNLDLPIRSALPGQEQVWAILETMIVIWAHAGALKVQMSAAAAAAQQPQQQGAAAPVVQLSTLSDVDSHLPQYREAYSSGSVSAWLHQQPEPRQAARPEHPEQQQRQQQQQPPVAGVFPGHAGAPWPGAPAMPFSGFMPPMGPGQPPSMPAGAGAEDHLARPAAGWPAPAGNAALFAGQQQQQLGGLPSADAGLSGSVGSQGALFGMAGFDGPRSLAGPAPAAAAAPIAAQAPQQQQRTLFGTPLEVPAQPATAPIPGSSTGSRMLDLLFNRRPQEQQQQIPASAAPVAAAAAAAWGRPAAAPPAVAEPEPDSSNWETVPTKAEKQQVKATHHHKQQHAWQQPEPVGAAHPPAPAAAVADVDDLSQAPSGPMAVPLFPQATKAEPPKPAPWAAAAPVAAAPPAKSLREIQEEEQARAAAEEAARADEAARAAAAAGPAPPVAAPAEPAAGAWGRSSNAVAVGGGVPPGWGPTPAAATAAAMPKKQETTRVASTDELPAPVKKATLGDILAARLGSSGRSASNASSTSAAAGPWGAAATAPRPAVNLNHIMQQEREETVTDLEGGAVEEDGLEDLIAALRQRNNAGQQQQHRPQQQPAAAGEEGLFWDYSGAANNVSSKVVPAVPAAPVPLPRAAVAAAAAAAQPRPAAPAAVAPPALATPWARAAASGAAALKAPPPGAQPAATATGPGRPTAAAVVGRGNQQQPRAAAAAAIPGAVFAEPAPAVRRPPAAAPAPAPPTAVAPAAAAESSGEGLLFGGLDLSPAFASWCKGQMQQLNGNDDMTMIEFLMGLPSNSEIAEYCQMVWGNKPGVSTFVSEFVKRKVAEQNRKPGGKKKKGGNAAAAAAAPAAAAAGGVTAAAVGLVHAGAANETWNKIPKKAGGKKKKGAKMDPSMLGFTSKLDLELLQEDEE